MAFKDIITEIQNIPGLWMSSHPIYKNRGTKAKLWREVATKLGIREESLKKRWKHLKDQYRKELKKKPILRHGDEADDWQSGWQYFESMKFLTNEILINSPFGRNLNPPVEIELQGEESNDLDLEMGASPHPTPCTSQCTILSRRRANIKSEMVDIGGKKIKLVENRLNQTMEDEVLRNDPDYMFLMSILPMMRNLSDYHKLCFRGKINDWFLEAIMTPTQNHFH